MCDAGIVWTTQRIRICKYTQPVLYKAGHTAPAVFFSPRSVYHQNMAPPAEHNDRDLLALTSVGRTD